jgi:hypothetical protein
VIGECSTAAAPGEEVNAVTAQAAPTGAPAEQAAWPAAGAAAVWDDCSSDEDPVLPHEMLPW